MAGRTGWRKGGGNKEGGGGNWSFPSDVNFCSLPRRHVNNGIVHLSKTALFDIGVEESVCYLIYV